MLGFGNKKTIEESGLLRGSTDRHSHVLPGVDDGVQTMERSLDALAEMERQGVETLWLTPHIMEDTPNETAFLRARFDELREAYKGPIELRLAAENMIDNLFLERWERRDILTMEDGAILLETSCINPPMELMETLARIISAGYRPILAHPERYRYMNRADYRQLRELGVELQLNLGSIAGYYSGLTRDKARWLLAQGMYAHLGSDLHSVGAYRATTAKRLPAATLAALRPLARPE